MLEDELFGSYRVYALRKCPPKRAGDMRLHRGEGIFQHEAVLLQDGKVMLGGRFSRTVRRDYPPENNAAANYPEPPNLLHFAGLSSAGVPCPGGGKGLLGIFGGGPCGIGLISGMVDLLNIGYVAISLLTIPARLPPG